MRVPWMLAFPGVIDDILRGNIHVFLAGMVFLALRARPWGAGAWAFAFLTKVTPGIGVVWHAVRGEWRRFGIALGVTAAIVAVSVLTVPDLWREWINLLTGNVGATPRIQVIPLPLAVRLPIALAVVAVAGWKNWAWLLPIGVMLALPNVWTSSLALLAGSAGLWVAQRSSSASESLTPPEMQGTGAHL